MEWTALVQFLVAFFLFFFFLLNFSCYVVRNRTVFCLYAANKQTTKKADISTKKKIKRHTFYSQDHRDNEAAHPKQVIHCHKPGACNMKKGVQTGRPSDGPETQTQRAAAAAELFLLMSSAGIGVGGARREGSGGDTGCLRAPIKRTNPQYKTMQAGAVITPPGWWMSRRFTVSFSLCDFTDSELRSRGASPRRRLSRGPGERGGEVPESRRVKSSTAQRDPRSGSLSSSARMVLLCEGCASEWQQRPKEGEGGREEGGAAAARQT